MKIIFTLVFAWFFALNNAYGTSLIGPFRDQGHCEYFRHGLTLFIEGTPQSTVCFEQ